jgi:hypothetical protein
MDGPIVRLQPAWTEFMNEVIAPQGAVVCDVVAIGCRKKTVGVFVCVWHTSREGWFCLCLIVAQFCSSDLSRVWCCCFGLSFFPLLLRVSCGFAGVSLFGVGGRLEAGWKQVGGSLEVLRAGGSSLEAGYVRLSSQIPGPTKIQKCSVPFSGTIST